MRCGEDDEDEVGRAEIGLSYKKRGHELDPGIGWRMRESLLLKGSLWCSYLIGHIYLL